MSFPARCLTVALLAAGLTVPATLHASGLSLPRSVAREVGASRSDANVSVFDWFRNVLLQLWTASGDAGGAMDPNGGTKAARRSITTSDAGGAMDPNGGTKAAHRSITTSDAGGAMDPNGGAKSNRAPGGRTTIARPLAR